MCWMKKKAVRCSCLVVFVFVYECVCVCLVYVIHLSKRVENNEEKARLSASFFVTFFREKKVEFCSSKTTVLWGERAFDALSLSLSGVLFREEYS